MGRPRIKINRAWQDALQSFESSPYQDMKQAKAYEISDILFNDYTPMETWHGKDHLRVFICRACGKEYVASTFHNSGQCKLCEKKVR